MIFSPQAVLFVIDALNESGAPYLVTGSLATSLYATPRSTIDADFVVEMNAEALDRLFRRLGVEFDREPQMSFETATGKLQHRFRHRHTKFLVELFEARMDDPHERARFQRRRQGRIEARSAFVPTAEDVIVQKLRWFKHIRRAKDRDDVRNVMIHQLDRLDWKYMQQWCRLHETLDLLTSIQAEARSVMKSD